MTLQELDELLELVREVAQTPVHVNAYVTKELSCMFCQPTEDDRGIAHHALTCVVGRAKELLVRCE